MSNQLFCKVRLPSPVRASITAVCAVAAMGFAPAASANLLEWTIAGPGTTSSTRLGDTTALNYAESGPAVYSTQTWTGKATAAEAGNYVFDWSYSGFHAFFEVTAFLDAMLNTSGPTTLVAAGPTDCCAPPSAGFLYTGSYTFANVNAGDILNFSFGGRNFDSTAVLSGKLALDQESAVPEPASLALLGIALVGFAACRPRRGVNKKRLPVYS